MTIYQCYQTYLTVTGNQPLSRKHYNKLHQNAKRIFNELHEHKAVITYVKQQEGDQVFEVRDYPPHFAHTIYKLLDGKYWAIMKDMERKAAKEIAPPIAPKQPTRVRKRIPAKPIRAFSSKNNKK